jgi:hypothetical protein
LDTPSRSRLFRVVGALLLVGFTTLGGQGCSSSTPGDPKDFAGPLDTSKAISSEDAQVAPSGMVDDGTGKMVKPN